MRRELGMLVALVALCAGLYGSNADFFGQSNVLNLDRQVAMLGIYAVGIGFVIITGGIDLSVGSVIGLTGVLIAKISSHEPACMGKPIWLGIIIALGVAMLIGLIQGLLITRLQLPPFIVTLGFMLLVRGVSQTIVDGGTLSFGGESPFRETMKHGVLSWNGSPIFEYPVLIFLFVLLAGGYLLHFSVFGRYVYAIGGNRDAAAYSGVNVKRVETLTYVISAGLGGVAGICYAAYIGQMSQDVGIAFELDAITAAVLGGCSLRGGEGSVFGVLIGSAIMKMIDNGIIMFQWRYNVGSVRKIWRLDTNWNLIIHGVVILIAVILDQVVHLVQAKSRIRKATETPPPASRGFDAVPPQPGMVAK